MFAPDNKNRIVAAEAVIPGNAIELLLQSCPDAKSVNVGGTWSLKGCRYSDAPCRAVARTGTRRERLIAYSYDEPESSDRIWRWWIETAYNWKMGPGTLP